MKKTLFILALVCLLIPVFLANCSTVNNYPLESNHELYYAIAYHDNDTAKNYIQKHSVKSLNQFLFPQDSLVLDGTALYAAVLHHNDEIATLLVNRGVDLDRHAFDGQTPLQVSVIGNSNLTRLLLESGATPNIRTDGETALDFAFYEDNQTAGKLLKAYGARFSKVNKESQNIDNARMWLAAL